MQRKTPLLSLLAFVLLALPSQAITVLSNTGQFDTEASGDGPGTVWGYPISTYADTQSLGGGAMIASSFKTGAGSTKLQLDSISAMLGPAVNITSGSAPLVVSIYSDSMVAGQSYFADTSFVKSLATSANASHPGTLLGTLSPHTVADARPNAPDDPGFATFQWDATGGLALTAGTTYWIVMSSTDSAGYYVPYVDIGNSIPAAPFTTTDGWSVPTGTTFGNAALYTITGNVDNLFPSGTNVPANSWMTIPNSPLFFSIDASVAGAPEPSKALLTLLGCAGLLSRRRRQMAE